MSAKSHFDYLIDVVSDLPYFLQEVTRANGSVAAGFVEQRDKESLQKQLLERVQTLKDMRTGWRNKYSTPLWPVPITYAPPRGPDSITPPYDAATHFTDMWRAHEYCTFQMTCILLFLLYQDLSPENVQPVDDLLPGAFPNGSVLQLARNICSCTEYLCLEEHGSRGYIVLQLPATIAYLAIDKKSPEAKWLYHVCKKRARSNGYGWGDFAMNQATPLSEWLYSCRVRHPNPGSNAHFAPGRPGWAPDPKDWPIGSRSRISDVALPLRVTLSLEEAKGS